MSSSKKIAVIGDAFVDIAVSLPGNMFPKPDADTVTTSPIQASCGGSACNTALQLSSLALSCAHENIEITLYTALGKDTFMRSVIENKCLEHNVVICDLTSQPSKKGTGVCVIIGNGEGHGFITHRGVIEEISFAKLEPYLKELSGMDHIHVAGLYSLPGLKHDLPKLFSSIKQNNHEITISLDPNLDSSGTWIGKWKECLNYVDIFLPNEIEAKGIMQTTSEVEAVEKISKVCNLGIVTLGKEGAIGLSKDSNPVKCKSPTITSVDQCGCGDAFTATFLFNWLFSNPEHKWSTKNIKIILEKATAAGSKVAQVQGALGHMLTIDDCKLSEDDVDVTCLQNLQQ